MRHFEDQLDDLRKRLLVMAGLVESAIYPSVLALVEKDNEQANFVL
jgi:phosphate uptake regulator